MADWPIAGMSNFGYPGFVYRVVREGPVTLITRFEDGSESRRQKTADIPLRFIERWAVNRTDMKAMLEFYRLKGLLTVFTRLGLDAESGTNFTTDTYEVRFVKPPTVDQVGPSWYHVTFETVQVL